MKKYFVLLLISYLITPIAAGHGIATIAYLLLFGHFDSWGIAMILGYISFIINIFGVFSPISYQKWIGVLALVSTYIAWIVIAILAHDPSGSSGLPFFPGQFLLSSLLQIVVIFFTIYVIKQIRESAGSGETVA